MGDAFTEKPTWTAPCERCGSEMTSRYGRPSGYCGDCREEATRPENVGVSLELVPKMDESIVTATVVLENLDDPKLTLPVEDIGIPEDTRLKHPPDTVTGYLLVEGDNGATFEDVWVGRGLYAGQRSLRERAEWSTHWGRPPERIDHEYRERVRIESGDPFEAETIEGRFQLAGEGAWAEVVDEATVDVPSYLVGLPSYQVDLD